MKELRKIEIALIEDRNVLKWKVIAVKDGIFRGIIRPI